MNTNNERGNPIRLIVSDLDGTLLDPDGQLPLQILDEIERLRKIGIGFTIISGRPRPFLQEVSNALDITLPLVACNGGVVMQRGKILVQESFPMHAVRKLMEKARALKATVLYYHDDKASAMEETPWIVKQKGTVREFTLHIPEKSEWDHGLLEKISILYKGQPHVYQEIKPYLDELDTQLSIVRYGENSCEIMAKGVDKSMGLLAISKLTGIPIDQIMAIGDDENDIGMLRLAGIGVAVANASPRSKSAATYLCEASHTAGVIEAMHLIS